MVEKKQFCRRKVRFSSPPLIVHRVPLKCSCRQRYWETVALDRSREERKTRVFFLLAVVFFHVLSRREGWWCSFDVGEKNMAYCVGTPGEGTVLHWQVADVTGGVGPVTLSTVCDGTSRLLQRLPWWPKCQGVLIEQQMIKNPRALRLGQHVWTWCRLMYPHLQVKFVSAQMKYVLGEKDAMTGLSYYQRKKWAISTTRRFLRKGSKEEVFFESCHKKDDLADAFLQMKAWTSR